MRVLFTTNIPSPYRVDFFNELGKHCDLTVLFESQIDKNRDKNWVADKFSNFKAVFMKGIKKGDADALCPGILKFLSLRKFDVIVIGAYHTPTGMLAIQYMKIMNIPFILSSDGGMKKEDLGIRHKIKEHFISAASAWLSTGRVTSEYLEYYGAKKDKINVYPFTSIKAADILDKPLTVDEKKAIRSKLGIHEEKMVLSVGRFIYLKGYDILLRACEELDKSIGVYIVGGKPTEEYLQMKKDMNLSNVHFVDFMKKPELALYYKAADLFVLPTRGDVWGLVINEAMAYGLPIITTDKCVAGVEMLEDSIGAIIPTNNEKALNNCIKRAVEHSDRYDANRILVKSRLYSIEEMARYHYNIFREHRRRKE
ncbi:glycosyltransferase family 4 protein [Priestia megaterium]|uniref:Glycosyltransferase family 4 protein n=1 Tax=Priestia megaterium TaxID=1404 RepID=A0A6H1NWJ8_PRIMG|nr:glycosyltransferase family 4 protein [Priestia megaterium]QIZ05646.1 glycosyltransferase family 4 protein [Priestia megaterium]